MYKVYFIIDGEEYSGIFKNMDEVTEFIIENKKEGSKINVTKIESYSYFDIKADSSLEYDYRVELLYGMLNPLNPENNKKVWQMESWLKAFGIKIPN